VIYYVFSQPKHLIFAQPHDRAIDSPRMLPQIDDCLSRREHILSEALRLDIGKDCARWQFGDGMYDDRATVVHWDLYMQQI